MFGNTHFHDVSALVRPSLQAPAKSQKSSECAWSAACRDPHNYYLKFHIFFLEAQVDDIWLNSKNGSPRTLHGTTIGLPTKGQGWCQGGLSGAAVLFQSHGVHWVIDGKETALKKSSSRDLCHEEKLQDFRL